MVGIEVEGEGLELSEKEGDEALQKSESEIGAGERKAFTINLRPKKEGELSAVVTVRYKGSDGSEKTLQKEVKTKGVQMKAEVSQNVTIDKELIEEEEKLSGMDMAYCRRRHTSWHLRCFANHL